jgi:hypothetical protein
MQWLKDNVYLAAWLVLPATIIIALIQGRRSKRVEGVRESFPLKKVLTYLLFLICFPLTLSPWMQEGIRWFTGAASVLLFVLIMGNSDKDWVG